MSTQMPIRSRTPIVTTRSGAAVARYRAGAVFGPRRLQDFEFTWLLSGSAELLNATGDAAERRTRLRPGVLSLCRPGTVDTYRWDSQGSSTHAYVHFELLDRGDLPDPTLWPATTEMSSSPLLSNLCQHLLDLGTDARATGQDRLDRVLGLLLDVFVASVGTATAAPGWVDSLIGQIDARWSATGPALIAVDDLASALNVSRGHLSALTSQRFGCGPARLVELLRLTHAAVALQRSNATVAEVSRVCGYANPYHFSRRFVTVYGLPPGRFRRERASADPSWPLRQHGDLSSLAQRLLTTTAIG